MKKKVIFSISIFLVLALGFILYHFYENEGDDDVLTLYGNVDIRQVDLGFRVNGRVSEMLFEEGDVVEPGALMGILDPQPYVEEVSQMKASLAAAVAALDNAEMLFKRRQEAVPTGSVSKQDFDTALFSKDNLKALRDEAAASLERSETRLNDTKVYAPILGTILTRIREPGAVVNFGEPIYTLSISSPIWVRAYLSEPDLGFIFPGMEAEIHTDTPELPVYKGHIGFISPVAEFTPKTVETQKLRTDLVYRIRVIVDNPDNKLKQGMPVTVKIHK